MLFRSNNDKNNNKKWQGKLIKNRWDNEKAKPEKCFTWLTLWKNAPTHTIVGLQELYQQLLPTKVYHNRKTRSQVTDESCRLCGKPRSLESVQHILSGCSALVQTKYRSQDIVLRSSKNSRYHYPSGTMVLANQT